MIKMFVSGLLMAFSSMALAQSSIITLEQYAQKLADRHKWPVFIDPEVSGYQIKNVEPSYNRIDTDAWDMLELHHPDPLKSKSDKPIAVYVDGVDQKLVIKSNKSKKKKSNTSTFNVIEY